MNFKKILAFMMNSGFGISCAQNTIKFRNRNFMIDGPFSLMYSMRKGA